MARQSSQSLYLIGALLVVLALGVLFLKRPAPESESDPGPEGARPAAGPGANRGPASRAPSRVSPTRPVSAAPDPDSTPDELGAAREFVSSYRGLTSPEDRVSLLMDARMLELQDHSTVYNLLLDEALGPDAEVREVARSALREYGGSRAAQAIRLLLESDSQLPERSELEELIPFLELATREGEGSEGASPN